VPVPDRVMQLEERVIDVASEIAGIESVFVVAVDQDGSLWSMASGLSDSSALVRMVRAKAVFDRMANEAMRAALAHAGQRVTIAQRLEELVPIIRGALHSRDVDLGEYRELGLGLFLMCAPYLDPGSALPGWINWIGTGSIEQQIGFLRGALAQLELDAGEDAPPAPAAPNRLN
jgi:hypothetical protein